MLRFVCLCVCGEVGREREREREDRETRLLINLWMVADKSLTFVTKSEANMVTKKIEWRLMVLTLFSLYCCISDKAQYCVNVKRCIILLNPVFITFFIQY